MIGHLPDPAELYAEEIPAEEVSPPDNAKVVNLFHYSRDPTKIHGVPCKFVIYEGEVFADTKTRIQERIGVSDKDFAKFKFTLVTSTMYKQPSAVEEGEFKRCNGNLTTDDVLFDHKWVADDALGLDHIDKRPNKTTAERGIVMR
jgi:ubiquitin carboxyl-terminal hydrolase 7